MAIRERDARRWRIVLLTALCLLMPLAACRDEAVGMGEPDAGVPVDERCGDWEPTPGELQVWNSTAGAGVRHAAAAVGYDGTVLAVWATPDGVWGRARCHSGAPFREGGLDIRLDDGAAVSLAGPSARALAGGGFVVTWRDDTDASIRATWLDAEGVPTGPALKINVEDAEATGRPPRVVQLTDGDLVFLWYYWARAYSADGEPRGALPQQLGSFPSLDGAAGVNGKLFQLRHSLNHPTDVIVLGLVTWSYTPAAGVDRIHADNVWPHLFNWGRYGFVLASEPDVGRAAVLWPGNWPYEIWLRWVDEDGLTSGDGLVLGDGGEDLGEDGWMDLALDGLGEARVVWRTANTAREIHTWTEAGQDQLLMTDWGDRPHFPRVSGYPDGGFLLLLTPDESSPDEDVLFLLLDR